MHELWLIYRCRQGDHEAFAALYQRYSRTVFRMALSLVHETALAEDITQEAFIAAFREIGALRSPTAFRGWLYRIVVTQTTRILRSQGGSRRALSLDGLPENSQPVASDLLEAVEYNHDLQRQKEAVAGLDEPLRLPVLLHYYGGLSVAEVAKAMGLPPGTVKSRLHAARRRLAEVLQSGTAQNVLRAKEMRT